MPSNSSGRWYGRDRWHPGRICGQIWLMQSLYYTMLGLATFVGCIVTNHSWEPGMLFTWHLPVFSPGGGARAWVIIMSLVFAAFATAGMIAVVVERVKKCMDFTFTVYFFHILFSWVLTGDGFPLDPAWWLVIAIAFIITAWLGEYLCYVREMREISVEETVSRRSRTATGASTGGSRRNMTVAASSGTGTAASSSQLVSRAAGGQRVRDVRVSAPDPMTSTSLSSAAAHSSTEFEADRGGGLGASLIGAAHSAAEVLGLEFGDGSNLRGIFRSRATGAGLGGGSAQYSRLPAADPEEGSGGGAPSSSAGMMHASSIGGNALAGAGSAGGDTAASSDAITAASGSSNGMPTGGFRASADASSSSSAQQPLSSQLRSFATPVKSVAPDTSFSSDSAAAAAAAAASALAVGSTSVPLDLIRTGSADSLLEQHHDHASIMVHDGALSLSAHGGPASPILMARIGSASSNSLTSGGHNEDGMITSRTASRYDSFYVASSPVASGAGSALGSTSPPHHRYPSARPYSSAALVKRSTMAGGGLIARRAVGGTHGSTVGATASYPAQQHGGGGSGGGALQQPMGGASSTGTSSASSSSSSGGAASLLLDGKGTGADSSGSSGSGPGGPGGSGGGALLGGASSLSAGVSGDSLNSSGGSSGSTTADQAFGVDATPKGKYGPGGGPSAINAAANGLLNLPSVLGRTAIDGLSTVAAGLFGVGNGRPAPLQQDSGAARGTASLSRTGNRM